MKKLNTFLLCFLFSIVQCIKLNVPTNGVDKCVIQEFGVNEEVSGVVSVEPFLPEQLSLTLKIMELINNEEKGQTGQMLDMLHVNPNATFKFATKPGSEYNFCFIDSVIQPGSGLDQRLISLDFKNGPSVTLAELARREHWEPLELSMRKVEEELEKVQDEFELLKEREAIHRDTNESTNARVLWLSIFSIIIVASLASFQVYYLKTYFKSKKLI